MAFVKEKFITTGVYHIIDTRHSAIHSDDSVNEERRLAGFSDEDDLVSDFIHMLIY